ncbi:MAG: DNA polymerase III subunit chi [Pseudomonadota bacterium]
MAEVSFYHLTAMPLEAALPVMLQRSLERGWRVELRLGDPGVLEALDERLWTFRDDSFLPHGRPGEGLDDRQPILLTLDRDPAQADRAALFLAAGAPLDPDEAAARTRTALLFDGHDEAAVAAARTAWRTTVAAGLKAAYWAQDAKRWTKKAESDG